MEIAKAIESYKDFRLVRVELFAWLTDILCQHPNTETIKEAVAALSFDPTLQILFVYWLEQLENRPLIVHHGKAFRPNQALLDILQSPDWKP